MRVVDVVYAGADGSGHRDLALGIGTGACVADVVHALSSGTPDADLLVDGRRYDQDTPMAYLPLCRGSVLEIAGPAFLSTDGRDQPNVFAATALVVEVRVTGGLDAGQRFLLPAGHFVIGRVGCDGVDIGLCSETVSAKHAALMVDSAGACRVQDQGSRNGVLIEREFATGEVHVPPGAVLQLGAMQLLISPIAPDDRPLLRATGETGVIAFDRMPRTGSTADTTPLKAPPAPAKAGHRARLSYATILAPLAIGVVLLKIMPGNKIFLIFMLMSPILAIATWAEERRRGKKESAVGGVKHKEAVAAFRTQVHAARHTELIRRRAGSPDLAETLRRAQTPSAALWQRRLAHEDFGSLNAGTADLPWTPEIEGRGEAATEVDDVLAATATLELAPLDVSVVSGRCLGIVGGRPQSLALARALVLQAAVHHGPADLAMLVLTEPGRVPDWEWTQWLPHVRTPAGVRLLAGTAEERQSLASSLLRVDPNHTRATGQLHLAVMDADGITAGRNCAPREMLHTAAVPIAAIVLADRLDQLPGACTDIIDITHPDGVARYTETAVGRVVEDVQIAGVSAATARSVAASLGRYEDADLVEPGAGLPSSVPLPSLFGPDGLSADALERRWSERRTGQLAAPIGAVAGGPLVIDLVSDGPHGLIAGTTGAGKSELLRTVVASMAAAYSPRDVTFVLIDYKGGSAFAECAKLPHTVGLVTDLDEHLGSRALTCLEAELRHRERLLRAAEVNDLFDYIAAGEPCGSLPRLVVAIDEFATLAAELPDFIDALVGVAQRGRSLGVHLLLATQRPRGAVKDNIRANSNLRIALRVHDSADSEDVLDAKDAAAISRQNPGRAYLRLGPGELVAFQSAYASGASMGRRAESVAVTIMPLEFGPRPAPTAPSVAATDNDEGPTDLARLVEATTEAAARMRLDPPRQPWPDPLPSQLLQSDLPAMVEEPGGWWAPIALADEPDNQRQISFAWSSTDGGLLIYGVAGSGTSTALATIALALARRYPPSELHIYALDFGSQLLAPLAALPHVGAVLAPNERERQERLIRRLRAEVGRRQDVLRSSGAPGIAEHNSRAVAADRLPAVVLMLDNWSAFAAAFDDLPGLALRDELVRVIADGPGLGIFAMITADRATAIPSVTAGLVSQKLVFRLSDPHDFGNFGVAVRDLPEFVAGRAIDAASHREVQLAFPGADGLAAEVAAVVALTSSPGDVGLPAPIRTLPDEVSCAELGQATVDDDEWWLPFGIGNNTLEPVGLRLGEGDHALMAGATRAGKSTLLLVLAQLACTADVPVRLLVIATARSPLATYPGARVFGLNEEAKAVEAAREDESPCLLLVDDAERVDDDLGAIRGLLAQRRPGDRIIAAGRADALRASYGHWTQDLRRSRQGVVLKPNPDVDGDLWGMLLPRRGPSRFAPGRGYLVLEGEAELVQVARP